MALGTAENDVDVYAASEADSEGRKIRLSRSRLYRTLCFLFVPVFVHGMLVSGALTLAYNAWRLFPFLEPLLAVNASTAQTRVRKPLTGW